MSDQIPTLPEIQKLFKAWGSIPEDFPSKKALREDIESSFKQALSKITDTRRLNNLWDLTPPEFQHILDQRLKELE